MLPLWRTGVSSWRGRRLVALAGILSVAPLHGQAMGSATGRPPSDPAQVAAAAEPPQTIDSLDCGALDIDTSRLQDAFVRPQPLDAARVMKEGFPDGPPLARLKRALEIDPAGLCHYREANRALPPGDARRVVFLGDSITEGWRRASPELFSGKVIDRGISGQNSSQILLRFRQDVLSLRPGIVHLMAGINDLSSPAGTVLTKDNITALVDLAEAHGIIVLLASITPCDSFPSAPDLRPAPQIRALNEWLRAFAARRGVAFVDYYAPLVDAGGGFRAGLTNDALHPNARGYAVMAPLARAAIDQALSRVVQRRRRR